LGHRVHPVNFSNEVLATDLDQLLIGCMNVEGIPNKGNKPLTVRVTDKAWLPAVELLISKYK
jgi:hypothetical protein